MCFHMAMVYILHSSERIFDWKQSVTVKEYLNVAVDLPGWPQPARPERGLVTAQDRSCIPGADSVWVHHRGEHFVGAGKRDNG